MSITDCDAHFFGGNNMYQCILSDIDGTLLTDDHHMSPKTRDAIKSLDIPFLPVSARSPEGIYPILKENDIVCPMICFSGGLILNEKGQVLYENGMNYKQTEEVITFIKENEFDCTINIYALHDWLVEDKNDPRVLREERIVKAEAQKGTLSSLDPSRKIHKLLCMCNPLYTKEIERSLKDRFPHCSIACSSDILIEIMNEGVTKADAINHLCDYYSINKQDIVAFGDNYNDKEMLESVGMGIAMGNAPEDIKNIAKDVTSTNNQDGIFNALQKLHII